MKRETQQRTREWLTTLRVEQRRGSTYYVVSFSNGLTRASLYGSLAATPSEVKRVAWETALDWLAHVKPIPLKPRREYRRVYFLTASTVNIMVSEGGRQRD